MICFQLGELKDHLEPVWNALNACLKSVTTREGFVDTSATLQALEEEEGKDDEAPIGGRDRSQSIANEDKLASQSSNVTMASTISRFLPAIEAFFAFTPMTGSPLNQGDEGAKGEAEGLHFRLTTSAL